MDEDSVIREILSIPQRCYICERLDKTEFDYMSETQYLVIKNDDVKSDFLKKGFCNHHFWSIGSLTTPETVASMGAMLIENNSFLSSSCLVCEHLKTKEAEFLSEVINVIKSAIYGTGQPSKRLCQPHFRFVMKQLDGEIAEYLSDIQRFHNEQLLIELKGFIGKRNNRSERNKNERTSWWRAVEKLVGRKGMM